MITQKDRAIRGWVYILKQRVDHPTLSTGWVECTAVAILKKGEKKKKNCWKGSMHIFFPWTIGC